MFYISVYTFRSKEMSVFIEFKGHWFDPTTVVRLEPIDISATCWKLVVRFSEVSQNNNGSFITVSFDTKEERENGIFAIMSFINKSIIPENSSGKKIFCLEKCVKEPTRLDNMFYERNKIHFICAAKNLEEAFARLKLHFPNHGNDCGWKECDEIEAIDQIGSIYCTSPK